MLKNETILTERGKTESGEYKALLRAAAVAKKQAELSGTPYIVAVEKNGKESLQSFDIQIK